MFFIKNKVLLMECRGCISHPSDPFTHGVNDSIKLLNVSACQVHFVLNSPQDIVLIGINLYVQGTKIFKYCACPTGRVTSQFSLVLQTHALVL